MTGPASESSQWSGVWPSWSLSSPPVSSVPRERSHSSSSASGSTQYCCQCRHTWGYWCFFLFYVHTYNLPTSFFWGSPSNYYRCCWTFLFDSFNISLNPIKTRQPVVIFVHNMVIQAFFRLFSTFSNKHTCYNKFMWKFSIYWVRRYLNSQPLDYESPSLTTRAGLPPNENNSGRNRTRIVGVDGKSADH